MKVLFILLSLAAVSCGKVERIDRPGTQGEAGEVGATGATGTAGADGGSCSVISHEEGATILCEDGSSAVINHGDDGQDGIDGEDGKVLRVNTQMIYKGYACGRLVFQVGGDVFINNGNPIKLTTADYSVSNTCKVKITSKRVVIETRS